MTSNSSQSGFAGNNYGNQTINNNPPPQSNQHKNIVNGNVYGSFGEVNGTQNVYVGQSTSLPSSSNDIQQQPALQQPITLPIKKILVVVAKDHEYIAVKDRLTAHFGLHETHNEIFSVFRNNRYEISLAYLNGMGKEVVEAKLPMVLIRMGLCIGSYYVTTIGCCGGLNNDSLGKVFIISHAVLGQNDVISVNAHHDLMVWRKWEENLHSGICIKPSGSDKVIFTSSSNSPGDPTSVLASNKTNGLMDANSMDMEIGWIWKSLLQHQCPIDMILPAFKGVSDSGNDLERQNNLHRAVYNATSIFLSYLEMMQ